MIENSDPFTMREGLTTYRLQGLSQLIWDCHLKSTVHQPIKDGHLLHRWRVPAQYRVSDIVQHGVACAPEILDRLFFFLLFYARSPSLLVSGYFEHARVGVSLSRFHSRDDTIVGWFHFAWPRSVQSLLELCYSTPIGPILIRTIFLIQIVSPLLYVVFMMNS